MTTQVTLKQSNNKLIALDFATLTALDSVTLMLMLFPFIFIDQYDLNFKD